MLNFLSPKLLPKIRKKPMCTETYEADNLISANFSDKLRGFIAYPSTKPPIELEFEFLCHVNIHYILLKTSIGNQKCSGIELFASNNADQNYFTSIGKCTYETDNILFCNSRKYSETNPPTCYNNVTSSNTKLVFFNNYSFRTFLKTIKLKVNIFRTALRSVPSIASIEVWGTPSKNCSEKTIQTIFKLAQIEENNRPDVLNDTLQNSAENMQNSSFNIPEEFQDDLTNELMTIPYTLPSGKTIDQKTLEKYLENEETFNRKPGDPFTGLKFSDRVKPILNVPLKSRIDMFLLKNSDNPETFHLNRSLRRGVKRMHENEKKCNLCHNNSFQYLYKLPCKHFYCRKCLLNLCNNNNNNEEQKNCVVCKLNFVKSDVVKIDL